MNALFFGEYLQEGSFNLLYSKPMMIM